jgi:hypothetical protein
MPEKSGSTATASLSMKESQMAKFGELNNKPFEHTGPNGTVLKASRCDFAEGYELYRPKHLTDERFAHDVAIIFHWHALNIAPDLNGYSFGGNDVCKKIHIVR